MTDNEKQLIKNMISGKQYSGFYFNLGKLEIFVKTNYEKKTETFLNAILKRLYLPVNTDTRKELSYYLIPAICEIKIVKNIEPYYNIHGKNFAGYGSFLNDNQTYVIEILK